MLPCVAISVEPDHDVLKGLHAKVASGSMTVRQALSRSVEAQMPLYLLIEKSALRSERDVKDICGESAEIYGDKNPGNGPMLMVPLSRGNVGGNAVDDSAPSLQDQGHLTTARSNFLEAAGFYSQME